RVRRLVRTPPDLIVVQRLHRRADLGGEDAADASLESGKNRLGEFGHGTRIVVVYNSRHPTPFGYFSGAILASRSDRMTDILPAATTLPVEPKRARAKASPKTLPAEAKSVVWNPSPAELRRFTE